MNLSLPLYVSARSMNMDEVYCDGCVVLEEKRYFLAIKGMQMKLSRTEFRIVACMASNMDRITRLEDLWRFAWNSDQPINRKSIQVMVSKVRAKLVASGLRIDSLVDVGYIMSHGECCKDNSKLVKAHP